MTANCLHILLHDAGLASSTIQRLIATWQTHGPRGWAGGALLKLSDATYAYVHGAYGHDDTPFRAATPVRLPSHPFLNEICPAPNIEEWQFPNTEMITALCDAEVSESKELKSGC